MFFVFFSFPFLARPGPLGMDTVKWNGCRVRVERVAKLTCHLSPLMEHESSQTFGGCHHRKVTLSWKHTHTHTHTDACAPTLKIARKPFFPNISECMCVNACVGCPCVCACVRAHPRSQNMQGAGAAACRFAACSCALCVFFYANVRPRPLLPTPPPSTSIPADC